jgi:hypothetical protein
MTSYAKAQVVPHDHLSHLTPAQRLAFVRELYEEMVRGGGDFVADLYRYEAAARAELESNLQSRRSVIITRGFADRLVKSMSLAAYGEALMRVVLSCVWSAGYQQAGAIEHPGVNPFLRESEDK